MKTIEQRINNIIGQLEGVKKIISSGEKSHDCLKLLVQLKAIKSATASLMSKVMEEELSSCLRRGKISDQDKVKKLFEEINKK
ncbi:MAG: metal-sensing transcriptional repressor [Candidatus Falkowbacteria bacterium]|nr:metal-sensing transcriptional repressor [Candidatus Falkowbacteria bacterium]